MEENDKKICFWWRDFLKRAVSSDFPKSKSPSSLAKSCLKLKFWLKLFDTFRQKEKRSLSQQEKNSVVKFRQQNVGVAVRLDSFETVTFLKIWKKILSKLCSKSNHYSHFLNSTSFIVVSNCTSEIYRSFIDSSLI